MYGGLAYNYGINETKYKPKAGDIYKSENAMLWYDWDANSIEFIFSDSPPSGLGTFSIYTNRTINITYECEAHKVTQNGNGTFNYIAVQDIGDVYVSHKVPNSTTFFTNATDDGNYCLNNNPRCSIVEAFEASDSDPWYYKCK